MSSLRWGLGRPIRAGAVLICLVLLGLAGCTPTFDWRELPAAGGAVRVAFPAKPITETRPLPVGEVTWPFTLTATEAGGAVFAVGHLELPPADAPEQLPAVDEIGAALVSSLVRRFPAEHVRQQPARIRSLQPARPGVEGVEVRAENPADPGAPRLLARVFRQGDRWVQVVALGPPMSLSWDNASWFVESVRVP